MHVQRCDLKKAEKEHLIRIGTLCALKQYVKDQNQILREIGWTCRTHDADVTGEKTFL